MRTLLMIAVSLFLSSSLQAQEQRLFLLFDFMKVEPEKTDAYLETEEFWAGIHKQRMAAGEMLGWDLWALQPAGTDEGYQFLTVNLFASMEAMLEEPSIDALLAHARKAYPELTEEEVEARINATFDTRDLALQIYLEEIDATSGGPDMKEGTVALFAAMKALDPTYEKAESEIFKPWHQQMVDAGAKSSWHLERIVLPGGSDRHASHFVVNMFRDVKQYVKANEYEGPESNLLTDLAVQEGLKTRDMRTVRMGTLMMIVRP